MVAVHDSNLTPGTAGPLVTVGIPAYNRPAGVQRAVRSVLTQRNAPTLEVLVSDDASPDPEVLRVLDSLSAEDPRVRVVPQAENLGHARNYQFVLSAARGEYFMWLADDDWLDPDYVAECLRTLRGEPGVRLVGGIALYTAPGRRDVEERPLQLRSRRPGRRLLAYYWSVSTNGALFALGRHDTWAEVGFPDVIGGDWLLVGAVAARGQIHTLPEVRIHRAADGIGSDARTLAESFGLRGARARWHHLSVAATVARAITSDRLGTGLNPAARLLCGTGAALGILTRFVLADLVREALGSERAGALEQWVSHRLRARDAGQSAR